MAKAKNKKDAQVEEVVETPAGTRPVDLAQDLGVNPKSLRAFLRRAFPRGEDTFGTTWYLNDDQVEAARKNFAKVDDTAEVEA